MHHKSSFIFEIPAETWEKADADDRSRRIGGICSTNDLDRQSEVVLQKGLDFQPFLDFGWFNDNHIGSMDAVLGYPDDAKFMKGKDGHEGWHVEGYLLKGVPRADAVWMLAQALQKTGHRRLGFSVEGSVNDRDPINPNVVRKATIRHVAITHCPVNTSTALNILAKSLAAGSSVPMVRNTPAPSTEGRILSPQSIEATPSPRSRPSVGKKRKKLSPVEEQALAKAERMEPLSASDAIALLRTFAPGLDERTAARIVDHSMKFY